MRNPRNDGRLRRGDESRRPHLRPDAPDRADKAELIRLALGPDGQVAPDVRAKAPGRGAWIGVAGAELETAHRQGQAQGRAARAFKTQDVRRSRPTSANGSRRRCASAALDRLGMEARAGTLITGSDRIEPAARAGQGPPAVPRRRCRAPTAAGKLDQAWRVGGRRSSATGA